MSADGSRGNVSRHRDSASKPTISSTRYRLAVFLPNEGEPADDGSSEIEQRIEIAEAIAKENDGEILLLSVVTIPDQTPLSLAREAQSIQRKEEILDSWRQLTSERATVPVRSIFCLSHRETKAVRDQLTKHGCDALLLGVESQLSPRLRILQRSLHERIVVRAPCDVFVHRGTQSPIRAQRILLAVSTGPHSGLAVETARVLARESGASVDVVHVLPPNSSDEDQTVASKVLDAASRILDDTESVQLNLLEAENVPETIIERSNAYDVTVLGAPTKGLLERYVFGSNSETIHRNSESTVLMAKQHTGRTSIYYRLVAGDVEAPL